MHSAPTSDRRKVLAGLTLAQLFFGLHYLAGKIVMRELAPASWAVLRAVGAGVVMVLVARLLGRRLSRRLDDWRVCAIAALFGVVLNQICFIEGLARTTATHSALINATIPVMTLAFSLALRRETFTLARLLALVLALSGVLLVIRPWHPAEGQGTPLGDLLSFANASSYSFFLVYAKRALDRLEPLVATAMTLLCGAVGITLFGLSSLMDEPLTTVSGSVWGWGLFIVLFPTVAGYFLNNWALVRVPPSAVAIFCYAQPVFVALLGFFLLGERPGWNTLAGAALIFSGITLSFRR